MAAKTRRHDHTLRPLLNILTTSPPYRHHPARGQRVRVTQFSGGEGHIRERHFYVYIMASRPWGTLYVGMTNDLFGRVLQRKEGCIEGFTKTYGVKNLVYFEKWGTASEAIHREKRLKKWPRAWKITLIRTDNPDSIDLAARWHRTITAAEIEAWLAKIAKAPS
jgi:putative endonuclease